MDQTTTPTTPAAHPQRRALFAIGDDLLALWDLIDELGGDVTDEEVDRTIGAWFEQLGAERDQKLDGYAMLVKETDARAKARREAARSIADLARADEDLVERLKARLLWFFGEQNLTRVDTPRARITRCNNGGRLPLILSCEADRLPDRFQTATLALTYCPADLTPEQDEVLSSVFALCDPLITGHAATPNEAEIRAALDAGEVVDFASYGDRGQHIRIK